MDMVIYYYNSIVNVTQRTHSYAVQTDVSSSMEAQHLHLTPRAGTAQQKVKHLPCLVTRSRQDVRPGLQRPDHHNRP